MNPSPTTQTGYRFDSQNHIHSLNGKALVGTTTVLKIISKPLTWWASGMAVTELGWLNPKKYPKTECEEQAKKILENIKKMDGADYIRILNKAYRAHNASKEKSADKGLDLHEMLEDFIKKQISVGRGYYINDLINPFIEWSQKNVKRFLFSELHCYSESMWTGGIADFGYIDMQDRYVLGDFKSSAEAYWDHAVQLGGYDLEIEQNGGFSANGEKIFTLDKPFDYHAIFAARAGLDKPFIDRNIGNAKVAFVNALNLYKESMRFQGFER